MVNNILFIMIGGASGATLRYIASLYIPKLINSSLPLSTLIVNFFGSFFFGIIWSMFESRPDSWIQYLFLVGFAGALTTFSTYSFESVQMLRDHEYFNAALNIVLNNVICISAIFAGLKIPKVL